MAYLSLTRLILAHNLSTSFSLDWPNALEWLFVFLLHTIRRLMSKPKMLINAWSSILDRLFLTSIMIGRIGFPVRNFLLLITLLLPQTFLHFLPTTVFTLEWELSLYQKQVSNPQVKEPGYRLTMPIDLQKRWSSYTDFYAKKWLMRKHYKKITQIGEDYQHQPIKLVIVCLLMHRTFAPNDHSKS